MWRLFELEFSPGKLEKLGQVFVVIINAVIGSTRL